MVLFKASKLSLELGVSTLGSGVSVSPDSSELGLDVLEVVCEELKRWPMSGDEWSDDPLDWSSLEALATFVKTFAFRERDGCSFKNRLLLPEVDDGEATWESINISPSSILSTWQSKDSTILTFALSTIGHKMVSYSFPTKRWSLHRKTDLWHAWPVLRITLNTSSCSMEHGMNFNLGIPVF
jgi:hypothetical protein